MADRVCRSLHSASGGRRACRWRRGRVAVYAGVSVTAVVVAAVVTVAVVTVAAAGAAVRAV